MSNYQDLFTWIWKLGDHCLAHKDGAVSLMFQWKGVDISMKNQDQIDLEYASYRQFLRSVGQGHFIENHFWRSFDESKVNQYRKRTEDMVRGHEFGSFVRNEMADFVAEYTMSNQVFYAVTKPAPKHFMFLPAERKLAKQRKMAKELLNTVRKYLSYLQGAQLVSNDVYLQKITHTARPDLYHLNPNVTYSDRFMLNYQLISDKPTLEGDLLKVGKSYMLPMLIAFYPEHCDAGWFNQLSSWPNVEMHVSQIIEPMDTRGAMRASHSEERKSSGTEATSSQDYMEGKASDHAVFKQFVADNDLEVFRNTFLLTFSWPNKERLLEEVDQFTKAMSNVAQLRYGPRFNMLHYRVSLPGQGYRTKFKRPDHEIIVANMAPITTYDCGSDYPSEIRLTANYEAVGFDTPEGNPCHGLTAAKSNSGKSQDKVITIAETFPLGRDWYIAEVGGEHGGSYQWVVEAYGGNYTVINPDKTVINPFPPYSDANLDVDIEAGEVPLNTHLTRPTLNAIAFILIGETRELDVFELEVAEAAMQVMYLLPEDKYAPNFLDYLEVAKGLLEDYSGRQKEALENIVEHVNSFLNGPNGRIFKKDDNLVISDGITGVDFRPLINSGNSELLKFYVTFVGMRYAQKAYASQNLSTIMFDEIQECTRFAPVETTNLVDQIVRMGRKDAGSFDGISQDISALKLGASLSQMSRTSLLYMESGHDEVIDYFPRMPKKAQDLFKSFDDPAGKDYREGIRRFDSTTYHIRYMFPQALLDLGDTFSPRTMRIKREVSALTQDPISRLALFRERMNAHE